MAYGTTMRNNAYLCSALLGTPKVIMNEFDEPTGG